MTYELENLANKTFRDEEFIQFQKEELFVNVLHILIGQAKKSPPRKAPPILA